MGFFKKKKQDGEEARVTFYDVSSRSSGGSAPEMISEGDSKETVNLCKRDRGGLSPAKICLIVALVLLVLIVIEFFGVWLPYRALEKKEAELADYQAQLSALNDGMKDMDTVQEEYRKYNYENFPSEIVDREEVLRLLEEKVFPRGKITGFNISGNTLNITVSDILIEDIVPLQTEIRESGIVERVSLGTTSGTAEGRASLGLTIVFKDASEGGAA